MREQHLHQNGAPARDAAPRPTSNYSLRLGDEERERLAAAVRRKRRPAAVLIREAMAQAGLI